VVPLETATVLDTGRGRLWQQEDGVLREVVDASHLDGTHLAQAMDAYESLCEGRPRRQLIDPGAVRFVSYGFVRGSMSPRARKIIGPMALLVRNPVVRMAAQVFDRLSSHGYPVRFFEDEAEAVRWLLEQPE
jgi:hypothetical protein